MAPPRKEARALLATAVPVSCERGVVRKRRYPDVMESAGAPCTGCIDAPCPTRAPRAEPGLQDAQPAARGRMPGHARRASHPARRAPRGPSAFPRAASRRPRAAPRAPVVDRPKPVVSDSQTRRARAALTSAVYAHPPPGRAAWAARRARAARGLGEPLCGRPPRSARPALRRPALPARPPSPPAIAAAGSGLHTRERPNDMPARRYTSSKSCCR